MVKADWLLVWNLLIKTSMNFVGVLEAYPEDLDRVVSMIHVCTEGGVGGTKSIKYRRSQAQNYHGE